MYQQIIAFWFSEIDKAKWFAKVKKFDQEIRTRFSDVHAKAGKCELWTWRCEPLGSLAEIIVLDQFSRNMYRDMPQSFIHDPLALALAQNAISKGFDYELTAEQRSFMYMPFMHSESLPIHQEALRLFKELDLKANLNSERKHKAIIERFGRYPHRNKILGRSSTPQEQAFLSTPGAGF